MSHLENMKKRRSVRTYSGRPIEGGTYQNIEAYINNAENLTGPFGNSVELSLLHTGGKDKGPRKIGTYGSIKGAKTFIASTVPNTDDAVVDCGYVLEKFVLFAAGLGLGTCWLGAFDRNDVFPMLKKAEGSIAPAITPVGYPADKPRMYESIMRTFSAAENRKPWKEIFYAKDFSSPMKENGAGRLNTALEMVRIGPSASNKQPWRLVLDDSTCHFYLMHSPRYMGNSMFGFDMQRLDMGIAMCHFELACAETGINGKWVREDPGLTKEKEPVYIASWL